MREAVTVPCFDPALGERMAHDDYRRDFRQRDARIVGRNSWKLERRQHFEEVNHPSREALRRGGWADALALIEAKRERLMEIGRDERARRHVFHRVRVVEQPLTPYMQWELHSLRLRDECGERVRIMRAEQVAPLEAFGPLPEMVVHGGEVVYEVRYSDEGVPDGAVRYADPDIATRCETFMSSLFDDSEDIQTYFARDVAALPPPRLGPAAE